MLAYLPAIYPKNLVKILLKQGFKQVRRKGAHTRLIHQDGRSTTISLHNKPLPYGTLSAILRQTEISKKVLKNLL